MSLSIDVSSNFEDFLDNRISSEVLPTDGNIFDPGLFSIQNFIAKLLKGYEHWYSYIISKEKLTFFVKARESISNVNISKNFRGIYVYVCHFPAINKFVSLRDPTTAVVNYAHNEVDQAERFVHISTADLFVHLFKISGWEDIMYENN